MNTLTHESGAGAPQPDPAMQPSQDEILKAISKIEQLFPAPRTLGRALQLLRNPQSDLDEVAGLITRDPALTADLLRAANSAFYGAGQPVSAVGDAVQKVGFLETIRLLNLIVAHQTSKQDLDCYGIAAEDFWAESLFSGMLLENLAKATRAFDADEAYTAGLLRFIGRLAINQAIRHLGGGVFWTAGSSLSEWELNTVGLTQSVTGATLLNNWKFPQAICLAVEAQDDDELPGEASVIEQAMHFLGRIVPPGSDLAFLTGIPNRETNFPTAHPFVRTSGLTAERLAEIISETHAGFLQVRQRLS